MGAVTSDSYAADNSRLTVGEVPDPTVGPGQVLVEVRAARAIDGGLVKTL